MIRINAEQFGQDGLLVYQDKEGKRHQVEIGNFGERVADSLSPKTIMASLLKAIELETGTTLHDENIGYFFEKCKHDIEEWRETAPDRGGGSLGEGIAVDYANRAFVAQENAQALEFVEKAFGDWYKSEENPVQKLLNDMADRHCSPTSIEKYGCAAKRFYRWCDYDLDNFDKEHVRGFLNHIRATISDKTGSQRAYATEQYYRSVLKLWFDVLGLLWPLSNRVDHRPKKELRRKPPTFTYRDIVHNIRLVKKHGTEEEKYYFCLATVYFPRREELGTRITPDCFTWNRDHGFFEYQPCKGSGLGEFETRRHLIPKELIPYIKPYSFKVSQIPDWFMTRKFHQFCKHIGFELPKGKKGLRGHGWHAYRHGVVTALRSAGVPKDVINTWGGWKTGNTMADYYEVPDLEAIDRKVQLKHPFIKIWAEK